MKKVVKLLLVLGILTVVFWAAGCGNTPAPDSEGDKTQPPISSEPKKSPVEVTLYFSDDEAMHLVPEKREVAKGGETMEEVILKELIKGPQESGHNPTIPEGTKLLSVSVIDGVAYVNFSKELSTNHWGGSTGETHTLMSVTNSLCELESIDKVQFLLEGDNIESLSGHWDTSQPLTPREI